MGQRRYERISLDDAASPLPGLRVYGRTPAGDLARIVVHNNDGDRVYYDYKIRGWRRAHCYCMSLDLWERRIHQATAARLPVIPAPSEPPR